MSWLKPGTLARFGDLTPAQFLREYWQQKPLFIKGGAPELAGLLDGNDLAGLALEEHVESRIVSQDRKGNWQLRRGPFTEQDFQSLPERNWTLLVQAVDHYLPELADLLERFSFLPHWRMDDVMVSYAVDGGGVGPHYDSYDVFLIQGQGTRLWRVGPPASDENLLPHPDLRILRDMDVTAEFLCEPGDILYLPPRAAHWGIARGECMTWSVGFRTPSDRELLDGFCNYLVACIPESQRYGDAGARPARHPGTLSPQMVNTMRRRIAGLMAGPGALEDFLGRWLSEPKYSGQEPREPERRWTRTRLQKELAKGGCVRREEASRFLLLPDLPALYVDGERIPLENSVVLSGIATLIADHRIIDAGQLATSLDDPLVAALVLRLFNSGHLYLPDASGMEES